MEITTARLLLREYRPDDLPAVLAYVADPRSREFYGPGDDDPEETRALLATFATWAAEAPRRNYQLVIALRDVPDVAIGSAGLRQAGLPPGEAELGLELAPAHWGRGLALEAARALLAYAFVVLGLTAVRGVTVSANARVTALVRRLGFEAVRGPERGDGDVAVVEPAWLASRGWRQVDWRLQRETWRAGAVP